MPSLAGWAGRSTLAGPRRAALAGVLAAEATYGVYLGERGRRRVAPEVAAALVGAGSVVHLAAEAVDDIARRGERIARVRRPRRPAHRRGR